MEISQQEVWDTHFIILNGGPIIIRDKVVENNQDGVIYSGEYVKLTDGFHAQVGSKLHIAVKEVQCENLESSPQRVAPRSSSANEEDAYSNNGEVINNGLETKTCEVIVSTSIYTISGQLIQTISGGKHDVTHLPSGMYILQHRMSGGSVRCEKIANNK
ncbi:MAG: T9SS type A sorting domain-containing protein [Paludibacteraceae bacterium]|nr:T9SS type A sorting domain-containing protein [Paludibacteraceae bacterium]